MSFSGAKYPTASGTPTPFETLLPILIVNEYVDGVQIDNIRLIDGADNPVVTLVAGTGYSSAYPIIPASSTDWRFAKGFANVQNVPSVMRITYTAAVPSSVPLTITVYGHNITTIAPGTVAGTYDIDVPVDLHPGGIVRVRVFPE